MLNKIEVIIVILDEVDLMFKLEVVKNVIRYY